MIRKSMATVVALLTTTSFQAQALTEEASGKSLLNKHCLGCHLPTEDGGLSRISNQRKTPEGWKMSILRMSLMHGLSLGNQESDSKESGNTFDPDSMHTLVKYLADTQGLAPQESQDYRYLLEQDLNQVEEFDPELAVMCGRCHSSARFALQRRTQEEWNLAVDFHLGQYPTAEYSLFGRDRDWLKTAREQSVPELAKRFPFAAEEWNNWQSVAKPDLSGNWLISGHLPGKGNFSAVMSVTATEKDYYSVTVDGEYLDGTPLSGRGDSIVYTGYEWRGLITLDDTKYKQVLAATADGDRLAGRMYEKDQDAIGLHLNAIREHGDAFIQHVFPAHIRQGETATLTLIGRGLRGEPDLPEGISLDKIIEQTDTKMVLQVSAQRDATAGNQALTVAGAEVAVTVYSAINALQVEPAYAVARIGGNGGSEPKLNAVFRARGVDFGADGKPGTEDDLLLDYLDDVEWKTVPRDEVAEKDEDVKFAGSMNPATGVFTPADAGPNPQRFRSTNNAGNLNVQASLSEDDQQVTGSARLLVTVQRWVNPPLK